MTARTARSIAVRLARTVVTAAMALVLLGLGVLLLGPRAVGVQPLIVLTGSMEPTLPTGGLAYMRPLASATPLDALPAVDPAWQPTSAIRAGDIITFRMPRDPRLTISHRVTAVIEDENGRRFATRGDNSPRPDPQPVPAESVVGTVVFVVPHLGRVAALLRDGRVFVALIGTPALVVVIGESMKVARDVRAARGDAPRSAVDRPAGA